MRAIRSLINQTKQSTKHSKRAKEKTLTLFGLAILGRLAITISVVAGRLLGERGGWGKGGDRYFY